MTERERAAREEDEERARVDEEQDGDRDDEDYHGDARTENPMAPASAGTPHGSEGTVVPDPAGPDGRPSSPETRAAEGQTRHETPVASPVDRSEGQGVRTASAA